MTANRPLTEQERAIIRQALEEDLGVEGDLTSRALVAADRSAHALIIARETCVISGQQVAEEVFRQVDARVNYGPLLAEGEQAKAGDTIAELDGPARALLAGERTALNFLQRMTGIATQTRRFVERVHPYGTTVLDTRKTTPGLRSFEKHAVLCGGGENHRMGLYDRVMIKDNHRALWAEQQPQGKATLAAAIHRVRSVTPGVLIEVEIETAEQLEDALNAQPDWILLDNMAPDLMSKCVEHVGGRCRTEASGGITIENVSRVAATGVDAISLGCLTHSVLSIDLSLEMSEPAQGG